MDVLQNIVGWLNDPTLKSILLFVGGIIMKRSPAVVTRAVPFLLVLASGVVGLLNGLFPGVGAHTTSFVTASVDGAAALFGGATFGQWLAETLVPVAYAVAVHSGGKNTRQWAQAGWGIFQAAKRSR